MPISSEELRAPGDRYLALRGDATLADAFAHLLAPEVRGKTSWKLVVLRGDGTWAVATFDDLSDLATRSPESLRQTLDQIDVFQTARVVERAEIGMAQARSEAMRAPGRLLVVTDRGTLAGVLSVTVRSGMVFRGAEPSRTPRLRQMVDASGGRRQAGQAIAAGRQLATPSIPAVEPAGGGTREQRYVDISCPRQVWRRTPRFTVSVCLTVDDPGDLSAALEAFSIEVDVERPVTVLLHASGFELLSRSTQELVLKSGSDSAPGIFHLRPTAPGHQQLVFYFLQAGQPLGTVRALVEVVAEQVAEARPGTARSAIGAPPQAEIPDRMLYVLWDPECSSLKPILVERGGLSWREFPPVALADDPAAWAGRLFGDLTSLTRQYDPVSQGPLDRPADIDRRLKLLGQSLWKRLPEELRTHYGEHRSDWHDSSLLILSNEPHLPWELVWPYGRGWEDEDPWCLSLRLSRWLVQDADGNGNPEPPGGLPLTALACVAPADSGLAAARQEQAFLRDLIGEHELRDASPSPTWSAVLDLFEEGGYDWLHVAAHGSFFAEAADGHSGLWLEDAQALVPDQLVGPRIEEHLEADRPAVFLNACDGGRLGWSRNGLEGWADRLITLGAGMFLAPLWVAEDNAALKLARTFYQMLLAGETVAEALRLARRAARAPGNPTWCAYSLYAHPNACLRLRRRRAA